MQVPRYVVGAALFAVMWAAITWSQHGWELRKLAVYAVAFFIVASALSWALTVIIKWIRNR